MKLIRKFLLALSFVVMATGLWAVPARRGQWKMLKLADGTEVRAELRGDAFCHFYQDANGVRYAQMSDAPYYQVVTPSQLTTARKAARRKAPRRIHIGEEHAPFEGQHKELVILANFSDCQFQEENTREVFNRMLNEEGFADLSLGMTDGSARDYFLAQSGGAFTMSFDVVGPVNLPHAYSYYGENYGGIQAQDMDPEQMVVDAVNLVKSNYPEIDFSNYDNDGDGKVDQVFILYAGQNESAGGDENTIWPHKYSLSLSGITNLKANGVTIDDYACTSELSPLYTESGTAFVLAGIGTFCHEFSHCLGLPDVYDVSGANYGMNTWSIMDQGEWNGFNVAGYTPAGYTAYERMYCGWLQPIELTEDTQIRGMKPLSQGGEAYIIYNKANRNEYYLLENRQMVGWDRCLDGVEEHSLLGLLITHVDYDAEVWSHNVVNCSDLTWPANETVGNDHQRLHVVAADNSYQTYKVDPDYGFQWYDYADVMGDCYPFGKLDSLTNTSNPRATLYNKNSDGRKLLNAAITNIKQNADGTIDFDFRVDEESGDDQAGYVYFYESFNSCAGMGGNDGKWGGTATIGSDAFVADNAGWWAANEKGGANACAKFGSSRTASPAMTPLFAINGSTSFTFLAAPWTGEGNTLTLSLYSEDDDISDFTISDTEFVLQADQWTECKTTITGYGKMRVRFTPTGTLRRFFLDEVRCESLGSSTGVAELPQAQELPASASRTQYYDLSGRRVAPNALQHGIYIVNGKKIVR